MSTISLVDPPRPSADPDHAPVRLPPLAVLGPGRTPVRLVDLTRASTVRDLAVAVGLAPHDALAVDGVPLPLTRKLIGSGVQCGSTVSVAAPAQETDEAAAADFVRPQPPIVTATWIAGCDAGETIPLAAGRHILGRAPSAAIRCRDGSLELHHAVVDVADDGSVLITQLAGRQPISVDGEAFEGRSRIEPGARVLIGMNLVVFDRPAIPPAQAALRPGSADDPWRAWVVRAPRMVPSFEPQPIAVPKLEGSPTVASGGLLPTLLGVAGAAVLALLVHQVMFLLFGLMGAVVAIATWTASRLGVIRTRRGTTRSHAAAMEAFAKELGEQQRHARARHNASVRTLADAASTITTSSCELWSARPTEPDAFRVSIGEGDGSWRPAVTGITPETAPEVLGVIDAAARLTSVPVGVSLANETVTALVGDDRALAIARSMLVQLAAASGPADWSLAIVSDEPERWIGFEWLAHINDVCGRPRLVPSRDIGELIGDLDPTDRRHLVFVADRVDALTSRTSPLRRLLASERSVAVIVLRPSADNVPALATSALIVGRTGPARWIADTRSDSLAEPVTVAGLSAGRAHDLLAAMARFADPESAHETHSLPQRVDLVDLLEGGNAAAIAARWAVAGADPAPIAPIGVAADGIVEIDLVNDGPHGLLAGTTGAGKSELLRSLVISLSARLSPDHVSFLLMDYKGGSTFDACAALPHVVGVVTDLDGHLAARALRSLDAELRRREQLMRDVGANDLVAYRALTKAALPRLVVVIDEFANLAAQQPEFVGALLGVAQRGRSLGVHLLLATQRPSGIVSDEIKANTNLRVALRVQDSAESVDVVGHPAAAQLPRSLPGRAVMRLGADESITFQTAHCAEPASLVAAIRLASSASDIADQHRPWLEPLRSDMINEFAGEIGCVGVVDDPDHQRRLPLHWRRTDGHLLLLASPRMGATTTLLTVATEIARERKAVDLYVIDAGGDPRLKLLDSLPICIGVVRLHEAERLIRLLARVSAELARRRTGMRDDATREDVVVMIDGIATLRDELDSLDMIEQLDQLDAIITDGVSVGIHVVCATNRASAMPSRLLSQIGQRWVFHVADPLDAPLLGVPPALVPGPIVGRLIESRPQLEAQVVAVDEQLLLDRACSLADTDPPRRRRDLLTELVGLVDLETLPIGRDVHGDSLLPIARSFANLDPTEITIASGEHVLVLGPSRSGRTTAMRTLADAWSRAHPEGDVVSIAPRRGSARVGRVLTSASEVAETIDGRPKLVVIDDAELVDDPTGELAAMINRRADGITVLAAGRPDALRSAYGHWTTAVRRSRLGLVMASAADLDGDLLSVVLPRRLPIPARPGLAWLVADGDAQLVQIAVARNLAACHGS